MKFYTNLVLTVIAGCLLCIVFRDVNIPTTARAELGSDALQRFPIDVNVVEINGHPFGNSKPALPITILKEDK